MMSLRKLLTTVSTFSQAVKVLQIVDVGAFGLRGDAYQLI